MEAEDIATEVARTIGHLDQKDSLRPGGVAFRGAGRLMPQPVACATLSVFRYSSLVVRFSDEERFVAAWRRCVSRGRTFTASTCGLRHPVRFSLLVSRRNVFGEA